MLSLAFVLLLGLPSTVSDPPPTLPHFEDQIFVIGSAPLIEAVEPGETVYLFFGVGELEIVAHEGDELRAELVADCRDLAPERCARLREKLRIEPRRTDRGLEIHMTGLSGRRAGRLGVEGRVFFPQDSPLVARLGIGDVDIRAGREDLSVQMKIGDLKIRASEKEIGSVEVRTRIGDARVEPVRADVEASRPGLLGARASSHGAGEAEIEVALRIGDANVVLE
jgi:hypothetical protein